MQLLELRCADNHLSGFFLSPRSITDRQKCHGMSLGFFRRRKSSKSARCNENRRTMSTRPLGDEFFKIRPNIGIMMNWINGNRDNQDFRYAIIAQLVIRRCHTIESNRSTRFGGNFNNLSIPYRMKGGYIRSVSLISMSK